jgi:hypothetical protein
VLLLTSSGAKMIGHEKRRHFRIHFNRQVQLNFSTEVYDECQVNNISLGGMFVNGIFPHKVDDQCEVSITQTSKTTNFTFKALATIVRQVDDGIALKFMSMSFESLMLLELILQYEPREDSSDTEIKLPTDLPFDISEEEFTITD